MEFTSQHVCKWRKNGIIIKYQLASRTRQVAHCCVILVIDSFTLCCTGKKTLDHWHKTQTTYWTLQKHRAQTLRSEANSSPYRADMPPPHMTTGITGRKCNSQTVLQSLPQAFSIIHISIILLPYISVSSHPANICQESIYSIYHI